MDRKKGFVFHPEDWLSDVKLSLCSYATKGAWMDLMCYMFQSRRTGFLMIDGKALKKEDVRLMLKCRSESEFDGIWSELLGNGVMKKHEDGTFYSKRIVEDVERTSLVGTATQAEMEFAQRVLEEFKRVATNARSYDGDEARTLIIARKRNGATFEDFKAVIASKSEDWKDNDKMQPFLRPLTLFGDRFRQYLAESKKEQQVPTRAVEFVPRCDYNDM